MEVAAADSKGPFAKFCDDAYAPGFKDLSSAQQCWRRIVWLILILLLYSVMFWNLTIDLKAIIRGDQWATTVFEEEQSQIPFPPVTICNYNRVNKTAMKHLGLNESNLEFLFRAFPAKALLHTDETSESYRQAKSAVLEWNKHNNYSVTDLSHLLAMKCSETILLTSFNFQEISAQTVCAGTSSRVRMHYVLSLEFGNCIQLTFDHNVTIAGKLPWPSYLIEV